MKETIYDMKGIDNAWCPGCGNFGILALLKEALTELGIKPEELVMVSGIGQAAKIPHYIKAHFFNGLHGRALPPATGIKAANPSLTVIAASGDGDMYGEGGNHFVHTVRRNPDITNIVHNNMVYGLTKGQASPTSQHGFTTPVQIHGVHPDPFNPIAVAISLGASFVARTFVGNRDLTREILKKAITHKGYALVDIFQPCVSFNKVNTYQWFNEKTYLLEDTHDPFDRNEAFGKATEKERFALGIFYINREKTVFEDTLCAYHTDRSPLYTRDVDPEKVAALIRSKT